MITLNIPEAVDAVKAKKIKAYPCHVNRASSAGQECERRLVYDRTHWDKKILHDVGLQYIFDEGNRSEDITKQELTEAGINIFEGQRPFEYKKNGVVVVVGHIDFTVTQEAIPTEAKSINSYDFDTIIPFNIDSIKNHPKDHIRGYLAQLTLYLFFKEKEWGILLFRDKNSGRYKQINVPLDYAFAEEILQKFERINEHIKVGTLPDRIDNLRVCKRCPFRGECLPDVSFGEGVRIVSDVYLEQLIEKLGEGEMVAAEHKKLDKEFKDLVKNRAEKKPAHFVVNGKYEITVKKHGEDGLRVNVGRLGEIAEAA